MTKFGILTPAGLEHEMDIDLDKLDSPDPLAYAFGYFQAKSGQKMCSEDDGQGELIEEYVRGYRDGIGKK